MKKTFTKFLAALALLAFFIPSMIAVGQAPVNTVLWEETWGTFSSQVTPSEYNFNGTTVYGGATLTYAQSSTSTKLYDDVLAGGTTPELLLSKSNQTWTISNIPTGQASEMTLTFLSNKTTFNVTSSTNGITISGSQKSWTISATSSVTSFDLTIKNTGSSNARIDNISLKVKTAGGGSQLTPSDLAITNSPVTLNFDLYNNNTAQTISYTTSGTGTVSVDANDYVTVVIDEQNKYISVTPVAVTGTAQTITVRQAADGTYDAGSATFTVNITDSTPYSGPDYVRITNKDDLYDGDRVIIAARYNSTATAYYAMTAATSNKPTGVSFESTTSNNGEILPHSIVDSENTYYWTVNVTSDGYTFTNASNQVLGYTSGTNFATGGNNTAWTIARGTSNSSAMVGSYEAFTITNKENDGRAIALNNNHNYGPYATSNMNGQDAAQYNFYLDIFVQDYTPAAVSTPTFTPAEGTYYAAQNVTINCETQNADIYYTLDGSTPNANSTRYTTPVNITGTTTIKAIAYLGGANSNVATATYTIAQPFSTIPDVFAAATGSEKDVRISFNNWIVSGVSTNGKNVFVTDNNGNGFVMYFSNDMSSSFAAGNILSGTAVACKLKKYNGFAELLNVEANDLTITTGGSVTTSNIALASLAGINTGALVRYENLECSVDNSGDNPKYYLSDGTTNIQVYSSLFAFDALVDGNFYNITGIYQQYNNDKEILPRSTADIEAIAAPTYTVTLGDNNTILTEESHGAGVTLPTRNDSSPYSFAGWCETNIGTETTTAPTIISAGIYHPLHDIVLYPVYTRTEGGGATTEWHLTALADVDAGVYALLTDDGHAFNGTISSGHGQVTTNAFEFTNNVATSAPNGTLEVTLTAVTGGFTIYAEGKNYLYASAASSGKLAWHNSEDSYWSYQEQQSGNWCYKIGSSYAFLRSYSNNSLRTYGSNNGALLKMAKKVQGSGTTYYTSLLGTYSLSVNGYGTGNDKYYLIASPLTGATNPMYVEYLINTAGYDLYRFNPNADKEWENYKQVEGDHYHFNMEVGRGYLYANSETLTLQFSGTLNTASTVTLAYTGWNLIGNSSNETKYVTGNYYIMNSNGSGLIASERTGGYVNAMEGIFVEGTQGDEITFSPTAPSKRSNSQVVLNTISNDNVIDRAIVRFNSDRQLGKLTLFDGDTKIYIPQNDGDYAIVSSNSQGTMPVNFKAKEMGMYTISVETEGIDLSYLHLIDRLTGEDVNLLIDSKYSFIASNSDMESRFILSFDENGINANNNETFAFQNGSEIIVNGEGELQIFDVMGRMVKNTVINGVQTVNVKSQGVYILKLNEKTQKIIVR